MVSVDKRLRRKREGGIVSYNGSSAHAHIRKGREAPLRRDPTAPETHTLTAYPPAGVQRGPRPWRAGSRSRRCPSAASQKRLGVSSSWRRRVVDGGGVLPVFRHHSVIGDQVHAKLGTAPLAAAFGGSSMAFLNELIFTMVGP